VSRKLIKLSLCFLAFLFLILTFLPIFLDKKKILDVVNNKIKDEFDIDLAFDENVSIKLFPFPKIIFKNVVFNNDLEGLKVKIEKVSIMSDWNTLIKLKPNLSEIELDSPQIKYYKKKLSENNIIYVDNFNDKYSHTLKEFSEKFDELKIIRGSFEFLGSNKSNKLENLELSIFNSNITKLKAQFDHVGLSSFIKINGPNKRL